MSTSLAYLVFFFNDTATTEIYTLSLHDALPISWTCPRRGCATPAPASPSRSSTPASTWPIRTWRASSTRRATRTRSEEHTSELQSRQYLVCRLLLEKKKNIPPQI